MVKAEPKAPANKHNTQKNNGSFFRDEGVLVSEQQPDIQPFFEGTSVLQTKSDITVFQLKPFFQAKLKIGEPGDKFEKEADTMADKVVQRLNIPETSVQNKESKEKNELQQKPEIETIQRKPIFESDQVSDTTFVQKKTDFAIAAPQLQKQENTEVENLQEKKEDFIEEDDEIQRKCDACKIEKYIQTKSDNNSLVSPSLESRMVASREGGSPLSEGTRSSMESVFGTNFSNVRVHNGSEATQMNQELGAHAFTHGSDIYFDEGKYDVEAEDGRKLLAHELTHVLQQGAASERIQRHNVGPTEAHVEDRVTVMAMTLSAFKRYTTRQADWFTHTTLIATDRQNLWDLLFKSPASGHILAGVGDIAVSQLIPLTNAQWTDLEFYCKGTHFGSNTVSITRGGTLQRRIDLGGTLKLIEIIIQPATLERCVRQSDLETVHDDSLIVSLMIYWFVFSPFLQQSHDDPKGGLTEFERIINLLKGPNIWPFITLLGRIRNLHRFATAALNKLVANFANTSNKSGGPSSKPLHLVLHTGIDESGAFQESAPLFERLILDNSKLVLMLEGQGSLGAITSQIPTIASNFGRPDSSGTPRIAQTLIAGHGLSRSVDLAGTPDSPDNMDISDPIQRAKTDLLLNTLMDNMDPATARIVYAGCLVGSTPTPARGASATDITAHYSGSSTESLAEHTRTLAAARGMAAMPVEGARASVGLSSATSLTDTHGNLHIEYPFDPTAFGNALTYVATGREPDGVMRAALEVAVTNSPVVAENQLRIQLARSIGSEWWENVTHAFVAEALDGVAVGAGVNIVKLNNLLHLVDTFFMNQFGDITVAHFEYYVNPQGALAEDMYQRIVSLAQMSAPPGADSRIGRFILEQGWTLLKSSRATQLILYLDATSGLTTRLIRDKLDIPAMNRAGRSGNLFPTGAAASLGRTRLAIAWILKDLGGDDIATYKARLNSDVKAYLDAQVDTSGSRPRLQTHVRSELISPSDEDTILQILGRLTPPVPSAGGGGSTPLDPANADVFPDTGTAMNDVRVVSNPYVATVIAPAYVLNVRTQPSMRGEPFHWLRRGDTINVMGFTHYWAAVDISGRLGFAHRRYLSPPP